MCRKSSIDFHHSDRTQTSSQFERLYCQTACIGAECSSHSSIDLLLWIPIFSCLSLSIPFNFPASLPPISSSFLRTLSLLRLLFLSEPKQSLIRKIIVYYKDTERLVTAEVLVNFMCEAAGKAPFSCRVVMESIAVSTAISSFTL